MLNANCRVNRRTTIHERIHRRYPWLLLHNSTNMTALKSSSICRSGICSLRNSLRLRRRTGRRHYSLAQCFPKYLAHIINKHKANVLEWLFRHLVQIAPVLLRQNNRCHTRSPRRKHLLLYTANRQNVSAQGDLARHRDVFSNRSLDKAETIAVASVIPADGPSLGIAPSGM